MQVVIIRNEEEASLVRPNTQSSARILELIALFGSCAHILPTNFGEKVLPNNHPHL